MVGVMTVVEDGRPAKSEDRKFKIRTQAGANDTGALAEVFLLRRFNHPEWRVPNLIVVDGSIAQINAAKSAMSRSNLDIRVVSVVKDERHKARAIMGDEKLAQENKSATQLLGRRPHVRGAISFQRLKHRLRDR